MDQIDRKIINMLEQNARASLKELSAACYISSPAIAARIAKLEKAGIITGYHASVNFEKLDYHVKRESFTPLSKRFRTSLSVIA